jgi:hypothetical protein
MEKEVDNDEKHYTSRIPHEVWHLVITEFDSSILKRLKPLVSLSQVNKGFYKICEDYRLKISALPQTDESRITGRQLRKFPNLTKLDLTNNGNKFIEGSSDVCVMDEDLQHLTNLNSLNLCFNNNISDQSMKFLTKLNILWLHHNNKITDDSVKYLTNLTALGTGNNITDESVKFLTNLTVLSTGDNITDESVKFLTNLTELSTGNNITDESVKFLTNLTELDAGNNITDEALKCLPHLKK